MKNKTAQIMHFFTVDLWKISHNDVSPWRYMLYSIIKKLIITVRFFTTKGVMRHASALTYSTLLSIVPILAVVFAIARGFGYNRYIEAWFREAFESQPQAADIIVGFVNSYLIHTKSGVVLGVGLIFMFYTVFMLVNNIEQTINEIWQVKQSRNVYRMVTDYLAMILMFPIIIVLTSGISIFIATVADKMPDLLLLGPAMRLLIDILPYILMSSMFIAFYVFIPNTHVQVRHAIVPGILAGVTMQGLQILYINSQIWVSSYNAIYGSFAALPLFMLWLQISWTICLFGTTLCYANQNMNYYEYNTNTSNISHRYRLMLCAMIASHICRRFYNGERPLTALELQQATHIPIRIVNDLLYDMTQAKIIISTTSDEKSETTHYLPAENVENLTLGVLISRLESHGRWKLEFPLRSIYNEQWQKAFALRHDYINNSREILLRNM